ncbi:hypothetical protein LOS22_12935 [Enterococcus faecium]|nr:hypothetical protein [Enterococcus faecium]
MKIGLIGSGQMGNRVEEVAQERGDTVLLYGRHLKKQLRLLLRNCQNCLLIFLIQII